MQNSKVFFHSSPTIEKWSYSNPDSAGIGGSETSHIELAWRLAKRGYDVTSFVPGQEQGDEIWRDVLWQNYSKADYSAPGVWFIYRDPEVLDKFELNHPSQTLIFVAQDSSYGAASDERYAKLDKYMCLCEDHAGYMASERPALKGKIAISGNGLKPELIEQVLAKDIKRNPKRMMYASSPDRGLKNLGLIFKRAREYVQDLELHVYYGFDNIDKIIASANRYKAYLCQQEKDNILAVVDKVEGITLHGRLPQPELYQEWCKAGLWVHPSSFCETNAITASEAMALGAIPITNPIWALREKVQYGILIEGNPDHDLLIRSRYVGEILRMTSEEGIGLQEQMRPEMMAWSVKEFSWERYANQMADWIEASVMEEVAA